MIVIALGGNQTFEGSAADPASAPAQTLPRALAALEEGGDILVAARSRLYSTPAWPDPSGPRYVNAVALLETELGPEALLARLHAMEDRFGRLRSETDRWASRTLDLDLIDHHGAVAGRADGDGPGLTLPHPRAMDRAFVLLPMRDVAPHWRAPDGRALDALIAALPADDVAATLLLQPHTTP